MPLNKINLKRKKMKKMNIFRFMIMLVCRFNTNIVFRISYRVMMILNPIFWALSVRILTTKNLISSLDVWQITLNKIARISSKTKTILIIKKKIFVKVHVKFSRIKLKRQMLAWTMTIWLAEMMDLYKDIVYNMPYLAPLPPAHLKIKVFKSMQ